jgi:hypothetical protein
MNGSASGEHFRASSHVDEQGRPRDAPKLETLDALALIAGKTHQKTGEPLACSGWSERHPDATPF